MLSRDLVETLSGKRIFLTGGTGFFGKSILDYLLRHPVPGLHLRILARNCDSFREQYPELCRIPGLEFFSGDIRNFPFPSGSSDFVIHAATPAVTTLPPGVMRSIILEGTKRALEYSAFCGAGRFLFISSGAVYGIQPPEVERLTEEFPCQPVTEYGKAKLEAEKLCAQSGQDVVIARCFSFLGRYLPQDLHYAAGNFLGDCEQKRPILIRGDGRTVRSYMEADDLVESLFNLLLRGKAGFLCNVGSDEPISILDLARKIRAKYGNGNEIRILGDPADHVSRYVPDVQKLKTLMMKTGKKFPSSNSLNPNHF